MQISLFLEYQLTITDCFVAEGDHGTAVTRFHGEEEGNNLTKCPVCTHGKSHTIIQRLFCTFCTGTVFYSMLLTHSFLFPFQYFDSPLTTRTTVSTGVLWPQSQEKGHTHPLDSLRNIRVCLHTFFVFFSHVESSGSSSSSMRMVSTDP